jgi:hypothetical protein
MRNDMRYFWIIVTILALSAPAMALADNATVSDGKAASGGAASNQAKPEAATQELQALKDALPAKKKELAKLRHKWAVMKGRKPTGAELKELEDFLNSHKGPVSFEGNPYINKNQSVSAPARMAYFKKLQEIQMNEERIHQLELQLEALAAAPK